MPADLGSLTKALTAWEIACHLSVLGVPVASFMDLDWSIMMYMSSGISVAELVDDAQTHVPATQATPLHDKPQVPQWFGSDAVLISQPSLGSLLQSDQPDSHSKPQLPLPHTALACAPPAAGQTVVQSPQWLRLVSVAVSQPSAPGVQSAHPGSHAKVQVPLAHCAVPLAAVGQAFSQVPQWLALTALKGEMGYPSVLTAKTWGFQDVLFRGKEIKIPSQGFGSYVMENVLFKISFPAEFHAQTAVEAALTLHPKVAKRLNEISRIVIETQESGVRIIDKTGPLNNPADRDHCLQYMVAVPLLKGSLTADDYEDKVAANPRIDALRAKMEVKENTSFTRDYLDSQKRSIGNAIQIFFRDGSSTERVAVEYPVGHRRRRQEGIPLLVEKFEKNLRAKISAQKSDEILKLCHSQQQLEKISVEKFMELFAV